MYNTETSPEDNAYRLVATLTNHIKSSLYSKKSIDNTSPVNKLHPALAGKDHYTLDDLPEPAAVALPATIPKF